jgi:type I restriction enzyme R subunit
MIAGFAEPDAEEAALGWLETLGYTVRHGPDIAFGVDSGERSDPGYRDTILQNRLYRALTRLNPGLPTAAIFDAYRKLLRVEAPNLLARNRALHRMLVDGVNVEYTRSDGSITGAQAQVIDFEQPEHNDWLAVNQFTVFEGQQSRRADIVIFVNGLPLGVLELKNPADEGATVWEAVQQLENYQTLIPALFTYNAALIASDGVQARIGALGAGKEWFKPWRTISGREDAAAGLPELQVVLAGVFQPRRFLDLVRHFIVFEDFGGGALAKKIAGYHQFHAVNVAVEETLRAANIATEAEEATGTYFARYSPGGEPGDKRVGVVWHTQGSGKSLTMAFYAGRLILHPAMENPTIVVITDRNDLDDQLFTTFARCRDLLRCDPEQAESRADLLEKLRRGSGGVVFTTIQKFMPEEKGDRHPVLSERLNIVVIADEAHRSQYDFIDGLARHLHDTLPNASFIGFTGTPIEKTDANTRAVFGDYISIYDIQRAVTDGATVPIYYESRLAKLELKPSERPKIDPEFEELTEGEEVERKEKLKTKWAQLEAIVDSENRVKIIARDLVAHFEERLGAMDGKAMIVCMSRRICFDLYRELTALRPEWHDEEDDKGALKVVMTGSAADPADWQPHIRNKTRREALANRFRNASDPFRIVIVRDMWLTGFDAPKPAHDVRRQADARAWPDAGDRARQPGVQG